jgi:hypothetical protein
MPLLIYLFIICVCLIAFDYLFAFDRIGARCSQGGVFQGGSLLTLVHRTPDRGETGYNRRGGGGGYRGRKKVPTTSPILQSSSSDSEHA